MSELMKKVYYNPSDPGSLGGKERLKHGVLQEYGVALPLGNIIRKYEISFHCYADDTQLYISTRPDETSKLSKLTECVKNVKDWMTNNFLY